MRLHLVDQHLRKRPEKDKQPKHIFQELPDEERVDGDEYHDLE